VDARGNLYEYIPNSTADHVNHFGIVAVIPHGLTERIIPVTSQIFENEISN
jgi:hypothetical protein